MLFLCFIFQVDWIPCKILFEPFHGNSKSPLNNCSGKSDVHGHCCRSVLYFQGILAFGDFFFLRIQFFISSIKCYTIRVEEATPVTWLPELEKKGTLHSLCLSDCFSWAIPKQTSVNESEEYLLTNHILVCSNS